VWWTPCFHHISNNLFPLCDHYLKLVPRIQLIKCHKAFFFLCFNQCNNLPMFPTMLLRFSEWISMKSYIYKFSNLFFLTLVFVLIGWNIFRRIQFQTRWNLLWFFFLSFHVLSIFLFCKLEAYILMNFFHNQNKKSCCWRAPWLCYVIFLFDYHNGWL
jgi:hypothetical protein